MWLDEWVLNACFAKRCVGCKREAAWLCHLCLDRIPLEPLLAPAASSWLRFESPLVRESIHGLKFHGLQEIGTSLSRWLLRQSEVQRWLVRERIDGVAAVPSAKSRLKERGYNQAALLAKPWARYLEVPMHAPLKRVRADSQVGRGGAERRKAELGFAIKGGLLGRGRRILLIDDVLTTGSTLAACKDLLEGGGFQVRCMAIARAEG